MAAKIEKSAVRTPEMPDSMTALISACWRLTATFVRVIRRRWLIVNQTEIGSSTSSTSAICHWMRIMMMTEPTSVTVARTMFSGPWCAISVTEKRSEVMRLISSPVRRWSKNEKLMSCRCSKRSSRMSASMYMPQRWPMTVMI